MRNGEEGAFVIQESPPEKKIIFKLLRNGERGLA